MNKLIPLFVKVIGLVILLIAGFSPLITADISTQWVNGKPDNAPEGFSAKFLEFGVFMFNVNEVKYDNSTNKFYVDPVSTSNSSDEFVSAMLGFQTLLQILFFVALGFALIGTLVHLKRPSKLASFLIILGVLSVLGIVALINVFQSNALTALAGSNGVIQGDSVIIDNTVDVNGTTYIWRYIITIQTKTATFLLSSSAVLFVVSLFLKGDYEEKYEEDYE